MRCPGLEKTGIFTTKSLYRFITHGGGVISKIDNSIWRCKLPLKIRVFLWQIYHGRLQASAVLKKRGWKGDQRCILCKNIESIDHIFFGCPLAIFFWACIRDALAWDGFPTSTANFFEIWLLKGFGTQKPFALFIFAGFMWAIWRTRNKMTIEKKFPKSASNVMFYGISFLQKWRILLKEGDRTKLETVLD